MPEFRTRFNPGSNLSYHYHSDAPSLTDQRYANDCDLSRIVDIQGGQLIVKDQQAFINSVNTDYKEQFADVSMIGDFQTIKNTMSNAQNTFESLPSAVRDKYDNDLGKFLNSLSIADSVPPAVTPDSDKTSEVKTSEVKSVEGEKNV